MGRWLIAAGLVLATVGAILHVAPGLLSWFGRLPGDIRMESDRLRLYIPITSMLLVSLLLTAIINLFKR